MSIKLNDIFMSRDISLDLRLRAIYLYVYSTLLYGNQTWILYVESTKELEVLEMWILNAWQKLATKIE